MANQRDNAVSSVSESSQADAAPVRPAYRSPVAVVLFLVVSAVLLAADLVVKQLAFERVDGVPVVLPEGYTDNPNNYIPNHRVIVVIPKLLNLQLVYNTGAVFGVGKGNQNLFVIVSVVAVIVILFVFARSSSKAWLMHAALGLVLGGALGNMYDRLKFNAVRDMFKMLPDTPLWPWVFNVADAALMIGVGTLMVLIYRADRRARTAQSGRG